MAQASIQIASKDVTLILPGVLAEPRVKLTRLTTSARWKSDPAIEVRIDSASASNAEIELEATGTYRAASADKGGPGWLDLTSRIARLHAPAAHRYVPLAAGNTTLNWLQHALVAGRVSDGTVRIKGDLARFPFEGESDSEFRVAARVTEASLDVHPSATQSDRTADAPGIWPLLKDIDADFLLDRGSMTVTAQRASAYGAKLSNVVARIPEFGRNPTLDVRGVAEGPLADMVRYVNTSPVSRWIGGVTANAETTGNAKLELRLAIPLAHASDSKVTGTLNFANNDVQLADAPAFSRVTGALNFTETGVRNTSLNAMVLGGQSRIEASTRADGEPMLTATGIATVPGLRRAVTLGPVQHILDRSQGQARYVATLTLKPSAELKIESDLIGVAIDGVAPLRKTAPEAMPLRIERVPLGESDEWRVAAGRVLAVRIERRREKGELRVTRGVIAVNEPANLPESGMLVLATVPRLDVEAWSAFLGGGAAAPKVAGRRAGRIIFVGSAIDLFAVRTPELVLMGRTFRNVTLGASRAADGGFNANIVSDGISGYVAWKPEQITARLSRLSIPAARKSEVVDALNSPQSELPALDIAAEQFEFSDLKLGRLELLAQNVGASSAPTWKVRRFDISNTDMKFSSTGEWAPAVSGTARRTKMNFKFDARDAGATLARLGFSGAMAAGHGALEGDIEWLGSPLDIDYPTLSGKLTLSIDDGRFLKVDTGNAARLLSLLSLQSLSRTLLFDGGRSFSEGFAYSSIRADATVAQGIMSTSNFQMTGASATALMSGTINLRNETQQLHLVVLPEIDASTAALALGVANPVLGLGAFLAQYVLRNPLSKAFALEYDIAGTLDRSHDHAPRQSTRRRRGVDQMKSTVRVAGVQMISTVDVDQNLRAASSLIAQAADGGAQVVALPEYFCLMGQRDTDKVALREADGQGPIQDFLANQARQHRVCLVGGTLPLVAPEDDRVLNTLLVYGPGGERVARYDKIHLFRFNKGKESYDESATITPGSEVSSFQAGDRRRRSAARRAVDLLRPSLPGAVPRDAAARSDPCAFSLYGHDRPRALGSAAARPRD